MKIKKKCFQGIKGRVGGGGVQGECERRIEVFAKLQKNVQGVGVWVGRGSGTDG